ncbi:hypothetical protein CC85DRAFT_259215 [Cutaneotrichosporon oleaginosum]|uniref:DUF3074 domain-containing protein n=1 Tax=Cutaneotrichosporon oleaginosum TaxID=879819 RepID=A0A0J0XPU3_9TREE|nr:uncharacterized protein CC85DRAFT_259215 [Cutaneotrichosporon oleaginosum]KLT43118.1 hypothetical protein CC85DRAFT_259215 [Cutaneotrichosporon oleaginosum]
MDEWSDGGLKENGTVQIRSLSTGGAHSKLRKSIGVSEFWCGRISSHDAASLRPYAPDATAPSSMTPLALMRSLSKRLSHDGRRPSADLDEVARQARVMSQHPRGIYEHFRRGLLEYHSEHERDYIESCRETECLAVLVPHVAEVWRLTYVTPAPTSPRTFVVLLLSRELAVAPHGQRRFMNISLPFAHPECPEKRGPEKARVRGKYVSVERVRELDEGRTEWRMATSSDAGGSIPRFVTNSALPKSIAEDVPSFLRWMMKRYSAAGSGSGSGTGTDKAGAADQTPTTAAAT